MSIPTVKVSALNVYGIWHKPDQRWIFGPAMVATVKDRMISEDAEGLQKWKVHLQFVCLSTGCVEHKSTGITEYYYDSRATPIYQNVKPPSRDWGSRKIPWKDCEWIDLGEILGTTDYGFNWDKYRYYGGKDAWSERRTPSWW